jgi:hypothetical protein
VAAEHLIVEPRARCPDRFPALRARRVPPSTSAAPKPAPPAPTLSPGASPRQIVFVTLPARAECFVWVPSRTGCLWFHRSPADLHHRNGSPMQTWRGRRHLS